MSSNTHIHTEIGVCGSQYAWRSVPNLPVAGFDNCTRPQRSCSRVTWETVIRIF